MRNGSWNCNRALRWLSVLVLMLVANVAQASVLLPEDQWDDKVALWLARAMVAEAGWEADKDHAAIAWVLKRRWEAQVQVDPNWTFLDQVRQYCSGMNGKVRRKRHIWIRSLDLNGKKPKGWPSDLKWSEFKPHWEKVLQFSRDWVKGHIKDPCRGLAVHWGGPMDKPGKGWKVVNCGPTKNIFYRVR